MKVRCPNCKQVCSETTEKFNPEARPTGDMIRLLPQYQKWRTSIIWTNATPCAQIFCPRCEYPLAPSGRFILEPDGDMVFVSETITPENIAEAEIKQPSKPLEEFTCDVCGHTSPSRLALGSHKRKHKVKSDAATDNQAA